MENQEVQKSKGNTCGIVGLCLGWAVPIAGLVLGIVSLSRKEKTPTIGILSIVEAILFWVIWASILV